MKKKIEDFSQTIAIFDENGDPVSKEDFLKNIGEVYDQAIEKDKERKKKAESTKKKINGKEESCDEDDEGQDFNFSVLDSLLDPENQIEAERVLDTFDFASRTIYITDEIEHMNSYEVIRRIRFWNRIDEIDGIEPEKRIPIKIYINTPGGDVQEVFNIISAIKISKTPVHTITYGSGYSGGFFLGICGHRRFGFANSSYLFHEGMAMDMGDAHKFLQHVEYYKFQLKKIKNITLENTKITSDEYDAKHKDDWFMTPSEALHYGVIDEIIEEF